MIVQLDTENADRDLTSQVTVLTDTPDASDPMQCQALVYLGDGTKNLDGTGGDFEVTIELGSQTVEEDPQTITVSSGQTRAALMSEPFVVPANTQVVVKVKSPNAGDSDVDVTAYLYDVFPLNSASGIVESNVQQIEGGDATDAINGEVLDVLNVDTFSELASVPSATATLAQMIRWVYLLARNKITQDGTTQTVYADDGSTSVGTASVTDDNTTFTRDEYS
jgi:hypothetical protein